MCRYSQLTTQLAAGSRYRRKASFPLLFLCILASICAFVRRSALASVCDFDCDYWQIRLVGRNSGRVAFEKRVLEGPRAARFNQNVHRHGETPQLHRPRTLHTQDI